MSRLLLAAGQVVNSGFISLFTKNSSLLLLEISPMSCELKQKSLSKTMSWKMLECRAEGNCTNGKNRPASGQIHTTTEVNNMLCVPPEQTLRVGL